MNLTTFNRLMRDNKEMKPHPPEWKMFLEICDTYLKWKRIKNPIVMELGPEESRQPEFYEQLFKAKYGNSNVIDILSIDGGSYEDVKKDFEKYAPMCKGIIAIHDIESCRYKKRKTAESWRVWNELKALTACGAPEYEDVMFLTIHKKRIRGNQRGIGVIIKQ